MAWAKGWELWRLMDAANCNTSLPENFSEHLKAVTAGLPYVNVPVLSTTRITALCNCSKAAAFLIRIPFFAPLPMLTMTDIGVARPKAHGQAIINTESALVMA